MELLGVTFQISEELLRLPGLEIVLLLLLDDVFEIVVTNLAVSLSRVGINALVVVGVTTHEMDGWQRERLLASWAFLLVEVLSLSLQFVNFISHSLNFLHVRVNSFVIFSYDSILNFKSVQQVFLDDLKL